MLDIKFIREQAEFVKDSLAKRHMETDVIDSVIALDEKRRELILDVESKKAERNAVSKEIGRMKDKESRESKISAMRNLGDNIAALDEELKTVEAELFDALAGIPNIPMRTSPSASTTRTMSSFAPLERKYLSILNQKLTGTSARLWVSLILMPA